jgi:putative transposase
VIHIKFLIRDRAGQFTGSFDAVFTAAGIRILVSPPQAPKANAICERIIGTLRRELFNRLLIVNPHHLRRVLTQYLRHYKHSPAAPFPRPAHPGSSSHPATADQPRRAPDPPETSPRRTHARIPDRQLTASALLQDEAGHRHDRVFKPNSMTGALRRKVESVERRLAAP